MARTLTQSDMDDVARAQELRKFALEEAEKPELKRYRMIVAFDSDSGPEIRGFKSSDEVIGFFRRRHVKPRSYALVERELDHDVIAMT